MRNQRQGPEPARAAAVLGRTPGAASALAAEIAGAIHAAGGRITFAQYMEVALYHPRLGYYSSPGRIGKAGDFFTSVSVGALFGRIMARQFLKFKAELGEPPDFEVVEFGGHRGQLRADVRREAPGLNYRIVEVGDPLPERITGCVFSNEFLDALPVHRVRVVNGQWRELYVVSRADPDRPFGESPGPLSSSRLTEALRDLPVGVMEGYTTEVNLRAREWVEDVSRRLQRGFVVSINYGYARHEYFAPHRREGTLLCYHRHTSHTDPFVRLGEQDITAHVEFTSLMEQGRRLGLEVVVFADQARFLLEAGGDLIAEIVARDAGRPSPERNMIHQLIHPSLMGRTFKVLIQRKLSSERP